MDLNNESLITTIAALFAVVAIGFGLKDNQEENLKVKNIEALAGFSHHEGLGMYVPDLCQGAACCVLPADNDQGYELYHEEGH